MCLQMQQICSPAGRVEGTESPEPPGLRGMRRKTLLNWSSLCISQEPGEVGSCRTKPCCSWAAKADLHFLDIEPINLPWEPRSALPEPLPEPGAFQGALSLLWAAFPLWPKGRWWIRPALGAPGGALCWVQRCSLPFSAPLCQCPGATRPPLGHREPEYSLENLPSVWVAGITQL